MTLQQKKKVSGGSKHELTFFARPFWWPESFEKIQSTHLKSSLNLQDPGDFAKKVSWGSKRRLTNCFARSWYFPCIFADWIWSFSHDHDKCCCSYHWQWPRSGELRMQKLKSHLVRTQSLNVLLLKPGVGQYIAIMLRLLPGISFLLISTLLVHSPAFFPKPLPIFPCVCCG